MPPPCLGSSPARPSPAVERYFSERYPSRESLLSRAGFRGREDQTKLAISRIRLRFAGASVLDFGCGDGQLLEWLVRVSRIPSAFAPDITLVDLDETALDRASRALRSCASSVTIVRPGTDSWLENRFDITLAIGVLDYYPSWRTLMSWLVERTARDFVFSIPRSRPGAHIVRRLWLQANGISLQRARVENVIAAASTHGPLHVQQDGKTIYGWVKLAGHGR
jgi:SAM-dependent methyltransferase